MDVQNLAGLNPSARLNNTCKSLGFLQPAGEVVASQAVFLDTLFTSPTAWAAERRSTSGVYQANLDEMESPGAWFRVREFVICQRFAIIVSLLWVLDLLNDHWSFVKSDVLY